MGYHDSVWGSDHEAGNVGFDPREADIRRAYAELLLGDAPVIVEAADLRYVLSELELTREALRFAAGALIRDQAALDEAVEALQPFGEAAGVGTDGAWDGAPDSLTIATVQSSSDGRLPTIKITLGDLRRARLCLRAQP